MAVFYIHKPDLDTCLTAIVLGFSGEDQTVVLPGAAESSALADPAAVCIEVGGSGQVELNNFDHHDEARFFPPACRQAYECRHTDNDTPELARLVDYVAIVDDPPADPITVHYPSLSNLFSGMLMVTPDPLVQFQRGIALLKTVLEAGYNPFNSLPERPEWQPYLAAKAENKRLLTEHGVLESASFFTTNSGLKVGYIFLTAETGNLIVGPGLLYEQGCDIAVIYSPAFGVPPVRKFTIAGRDWAVNHLLPHLAQLESGWGGREKIIGSPRNGGSVLKKNIIIELVRNYV